ncbi:hypothetical protein AB0K12_07310 [Nonomuraea sp. NPDC049419]|uniref:hypothetical protein n=1 Tax=Nonomuraea sp. NPDC049419 TaxID=3155772 RepID=UPI00342C1F2D
MTPQVGIDPALMTRLINGMRRTAQTLPEVAVHIERHLTALGLQVWGPSHLHTVARRLTDQLPALQGRLDLILATPDSTLGEDGLLWADESAWLSKSPAEGTTNAQSLTTRLRTELTAHALTPETVAALERHKNDPYFALAFTRLIGPAELRTLIARAYGSGLPPSQRPLQYDVATQDRLTTILSTLLATASRGAGRLTLPPDYTGLLTADLHLPGNAFALKRLLQDGTFDHTFLLTLVRKLYDLDLAHPPDLSLPRDAWTTPSPRDTTPGDLSPMGTALAALAHHPAVAQDFFTDPDRRPLAYLMRTHPWHGTAGTDLAWAIESATTEFRDHDLPPGESRGYKSALIASWALHFWSDPKVQSNLSGSRPHVARILATYISDVHRDTQAFSDEVPGVVTSLDPDKNVKGLEAYGARFSSSDLTKIMTWAFVDEGAFETVATAHGLYSAEVLDQLAGKVSAEVQADFTEWRHSHPETTPQQLKAKWQDILEERMSRSGGAAFSRAACDLSMTTWAITDAANISMISAAKEDDARLTFFKDLAEQAVGFLAGPPGTLVGTVAETARDQMFGQIKPSHEETARQDADTAVGAAKHMFTDLTAAAMMRHGLFGDAAAQARSHPYHHADFSPGTPGHFLDDGHLIPWADMNADQRRAYDEWLRLNDTGRVFAAPDAAITSGFRDAKNIYSGHGS